MSSGPPLPLMDLESVDNDHDDPTDSNQYELAFVLTAIDLNNHFFKTTLTFLF